MVEAAMRTSRTLNAGSLRSPLARIHEQAFADSIVGSRNGCQNVLPLGIEKANADSEVRTPFRQVSLCSFEFARILVPGEDHPHGPQSRVV